MWNWSYIWKCIITLKWCWPTGRQGCCPDETWFQRAWNLAWQEVCCCFCFSMELRNLQWRTTFIFHLTTYLWLKWRNQVLNPLLRLISLDWGVNQFPIDFYQNLSRVTVLFANTDKAFSKHAQLSGAWYPLCSAAERKKKMHNSTQKFLFGRRSILDLKGLTWVSIHKIPSIAF